METKITWKFNDIETYYGQQSLLQIISLLQPKDYWRKKVIKENIGVTNNFVL